MKPRRISSKKWTPLPHELQDEIKNVFIEAFQTKLAPKTQFLIEGRIYPEEICLRVGYLEPGRLTQHNFEVSMDSEVQSESPLERIHLCVDAAASMLLEHVESDVEMDLPDDWVATNFNQQTLYMQHSTVNTTLESEADRLLGLDSTGLVHEDDLIADEAQAVAEFLSSPKKDDNLH